MLIHISPVRIPYNTLYPRIPRTIIKNNEFSENNLIKRICFSTSIQGCATAMPNGIKTLFNIINLEEKVGLPSIIHVYSIDEKNIDKNNILNDEYLFKNKLVPDVQYTKEHWVINQNVKCNHTVIRLKNFTIEEHESSWNKNVHLFILKNFEFENEIEPYERDFNYCFYNKEDFLKIKKFIYNSEYKLNKEYLDKNNNYFEISIHVPAYINSRRLWEKVTFLFWKTFNEKLKKQCNKKINKTTILRNI